MKKSYTVDEILEMALDAGLTAPEWQWKALKPYNGFSHEERVKGWQASKLAVKMGLLAEAQSLKCEVCGAESPTPLAYHSEDYSKLAHHVVCKSCHFQIHKGTISVKSLLSVVF